MTEDLSPRPSDRSGATGRPRPPTPRPGTTAIRAARDLNAYATDAQAIALVAAALRDDRKPAARFSAVAYVRDHLLLADLPAVLPSRRRHLSRSMRDLLADPVSGLQYDTPHLEIRLAFLARRAATTIRRHGAWNAPELSAYRARVDLAEEVLQVTLRALEILDLRSEIGPAPANSALAATQWSDAMARLDRAAETLAVRVEKLHILVRELDHLERQRSVLAAIERSKGFESRLRGIEDRTVADADQAVWLDDVVSDISDVEQLVGSIVNTLERAQAPHAEGSL